MQRIFDQVKQIIKVSGLVDSISCRNELLTTLRPLFLLKLWYNLKKLIRSGFMRNKNTCFRFLKYFTTIRLK